MAKWKSAPILERKEEQKLWKEFKLAQDVFFAARTAALSVLDEEHSRNLEAKKLLAANPKYGNDPSKVSDQEAMQYMKFLRMNDQNNAYLTMH